MQDYEYDENELQKMSIKRTNKVLVVTPQTAAVLFNRGIVKIDHSQCFALVLDKVNMHQAFDLDQELIELAKSKNF